MNFEPSLQLDYVRSERQASLDGELDVEEDGESTKRGLDECVGMYPSAH